MKQFEILARHLRVQCERAHGFAARDGTQEARAVSLLMGHLSEAALNAAEEIRKAHEESLARWAEAFAGMPPPSPTTEEQIAWAKQDKPKGVGTMELLELCASHMHALSDRKRKEFMKHLASIYCQGCGAPVAYCTCEK